MKQILLIALVLPFILNAWTFVPGGVEPQKGQWIAFGGKCNEDCSHPGWHITR